jgi:hypothetical protein
MAMATPSVPTLNLANCVDKAHEGKALRSVDCVESHPNLMQMGHQRGDVGGGDGCRRV